jgi:branched-subunit amino acid aminotransferase/4-amino-4-deoxychorismate lyase
MLELDGRPPDEAETERLAVLNYGHFTSMVASNLRVRGLALHLERLQRDGQAVFGRTIDPDRVRRLLRRIAVNCPVPTMLRAAVLENGDDLSLLVTTRAPAATDGSGLRVRTAGYVRDRPTLKHFGFFGALHHRRLAVQAGYDDALLVAASGLVAEGPTWNVAVVIGDELIWPDDNCLPGVTRSLLQQVSTDAGQTWSSRPVHRDELAGLRAAFATSASGVRAITAIDDVELPGAPDIETFLRAGYQALPGELL